MTMYAETMKQGAAALRRATPANPMEVLARLRQENQQAGFEELLKQWRKRVEGNRAMLDATLLYAFRNYWTDLDRQDREKERRKRKPAEEVDARAQQVGEAIRNFILLDLLLPNGKPLRASTFKECRQAGGWFARVARLGKPSQIVGDVVSEQKLQALGF